MYKRYFVILEYLPGFDEWVFVEYNMKVIAKSGCKWVKVVNIVEKSTTKTLLKTTEPNEKDSKDYECLDSVAFCSELIKLFL